jgi:uncharacterized membrane protein YraQ (UPF0718 family)
MGDGLDWLASRLDWTIAIAFTILAIGLAIIAGLVIGERFRRSRLIEREEKNKRRKS